MKFKHLYWNEVGCPVQVEGEIGRTENAKRQHLSLTSKQKTALSKLATLTYDKGVFRFADGILFDGYVDRTYTGMYGYSKSEVIAARFIVYGEPVTLAKY